MKIKSHVFAADDLVLGPIWYLSLAPHSSDHSVDDCALLVYFASTRPGWGIMDMYNIIHLGIVRLNTVLKTSFHKM